MTGLSPSDDRFALRLFRISVTCAVCLLVACTGSHETKTDSRETKYSSVPRGPLDGSDTQTVADSIVGDMLQGEWLQRWTEDHDEPPTVLIGRIENTTMPYIDTDTLYYHVNQWLRKADTVRVAPEIGRKIRKEVRSKHRRPPDYRRGVPREEIMSKSKNNGADFVVWGSSRSAVKEDLEDNQALLLYTVSLALINLDANQKVWVAEKEIEKIVKRSKLTR